MISVKPLLYSFVLLSPLSGQRMRTAPLDLVQRLHPLFHPFNEDLLVLRTEDARILNFRNPSVLLSCITANSQLLDPCSSPSPINYNHFAGAEKLLDLGLGIISFGLSLILDISAFTAESPLLHLVLGKHLAFIARCSPCPELTMGVEDSADKTRFSQANPP